MSNKKFIAFVGLFAFLIVGFVGGVNYVVDPLWTFSHQNKFNQIQSGFDERQQKTNKIYFDKSLNYNGILLGSSRATFINQNYFNTNMKIFNYASSSMFPYEYKGYLDFAKRVKGKDLDYVVIGADFFGSKVPRDVKFEKPEFYIKNTINSFYQYKSLLSSDLFIKSVKNIKNIKLHPESFYSRDNIKTKTKPSEAKRIKAFKTNLKRHTDELSGSKYTYNEDYFNILKIIKQENPTTKFIIFTSPITADLISSILTKGNNFENHKRWLNEIVEVFGEVYDFCGVNSITKNVYNYPDDDHYYAPIGKLVSHKISGVKDANIPKDFGVLVTKQNIDEHLQNLKEQIKAYDLNKTQ